MESIDILTGQHVTIKYAPASLLRRGLGLIIDYAIIVLYLFLFFYSLSSFHFLDVFSLSLRDGMEVILLLPVLCYHFLFETFMNGRTPGKIITGTRVTMKDGSTPGLTAYFLRWVLLPIDLFPMGIGIGGLCIGISRYQQRIGDMAAGAVVVRNAKPKRLNLETDFMEFSEAYQPLFNTQVELLTDGQIRFISRVLYDPRDKRAVIKTVQDLSFKVKEITRLESPLDDRSFLETVVRDYNFYAWHGA